MDEVRTWFARLLAPAAFLAAVVILVIVVQRALDGNSAVQGAGVTEPAVSVVVDTAPDETATEESTNSAERRFYRIKSGDTLEAIAVRFDTSVETLLELNPNLDPLALSPGDRIRVA